MLVADAVARHLTRKLAQIECQLQSFCAAHGVVFVSTAAWEVMKGSNVP
jgi:hypothetical protein